MKKMYRFKLTWSLLIIPHLHLIYDFFSRLNLNLTFNKFCTLKGDDILIAFASLPRPSPTYHDRNTDVGNSADFQTELDEVAFFIGNQHLLASLATASFV